MSRGLGLMERRALYWLQRDRRELRGFVSQYATQVSLCTPDLAYLIFADVTVDFRRSFFRTWNIQVDISQLNSTNRALNRLCTKGLIIKGERVAFGVRMWSAAADAPVVANK